MKFTLKQIEDLIGEDEWEVKDMGASDPIYSTKNVIRNKLRRQLRTKLSTMKGDK